MSFMISHNGEVSDSMSENRSSGLALQVAQMELVQLIGMVRSSPRDETVCSASLRADVLRNVESAEECSYTRRIGRGDDQNNVTGPTVRFAEAVQRAWGRARISTEVIDIDDRFVVAEGRFLDLQTLTSVSRQVRRSIVKRDGNTYGPEMIATASNAACSIALRNIVLYGGVPSSFWQPVYEDARHLVRKHVSGDLASKCRSVLEVFSRDYGVKSETVLSYLDLTSIDAMRVSDVVDLRGLYIAIRDSEVDAASVFEGFGSVSAKPTTNKKAQVRTPPKAEQVTSNVPQVPKQESVTVPDTAKIQYTESAVSAAFGAQSDGVPVVADEPSAQEKRIVPGSMTIEEMSSQYRDGKITADAAIELLESGLVSTDFPVALSWVSNLLAADRIELVRHLGQALTGHVNEGRLPRDLVDKSMRSMIARVKAEL